MAGGSLLVFLFVGGVAGWLASLIIRGSGLGIIGNIVVGVIGAFISGLVLPQVGISLASGMIGSIIHAMIGAIIFLFLVRLIKKA